jgi:hypothetical protein
VNTIQKILFWSVTILLGFINPLISVTLIILYYLPKIISDICNHCTETHLEDTFEEGDTHHSQSNNMNSFSKQTMDEMK